MVLHAYLCMFTQPLQVSSISCAFITVYHYYLNSGQVYIVTLLIFGTEVIDDTVIKYICTCTIVKYVHVNMLLMHEVLLKVHVICHAAQEARVHNSTIIQLCFEVSSLKGKTLYHIYGNHAIHIFKFQIFFFVNLLCLFAQLTKLGNVYSNLAEMSLFRHTHWTINGVCSYVG